MTLKLMNVPGIDDMNIIRFASATELNSYFAGKVVKEIEYSYFPPHYTDKIKIEVDDIKYTNINYLMINQYYRNYYYFIESIEYINESLIEISIRMDTIMTYYVNIEIDEGIVERKHIDRFLYDSNRINRDYIRENLSDGLFLEQEKNYIVRPDDLKWLIVKTTAELRIGVNNPRASYINAPNAQKEFPSAYGFYIGPMDNHSITVKYTDLQTESVTYPYVSLLGAIKDNRVVDIYVVPFNPIDELEYNETNHELSCSWPSTKTANDIIPFMTWNYDEYTGLGVNGKFALINQKVYTQNVKNNPLYLERNTHLGYAYQSRYIPCLLDSNYIRFSFGSENSNVSYPLHAIEYIDESSTYGLSLMYTCNIEDGTKTYIVTQPSDNPAKFSAIAIDSNVPSMSLANDPWKDYQANIKGRLFSVGMDVVSSAAGCFIDVAGISAGAKIRKSRVMNDARNYDRRATRNPRLKRKPLDRLNAITDEAAIDTRDAMAGFGKGIIGAIGSEIATAANAMWAAPTAKSLGNIMDSDSSYQLAIWYQWSIVDDIEFVALYYHKYGNLVNKMYPYHGAFYDEFNNRYYFNYIKFASITLHLTSFGNEVMVAEAGVIEDIAQRFMNGMTMWNKQFAIGANVDKDNIENSIL